MKDKKKKTKQQKMDQKYFLIFITPKIRVFAVACFFIGRSVACLPSFVSLFSQVFLDCSLRGSLVKLISPSYPLPNLWIFAFFFNQLYTFRKHFLYFPSLLRFLVLGHFLSCLLTFQTFCSLFLSFSFA